MGIEIHITSEQAKNEAFLNAQIKLAEALGCELLIDYQEKKRMRFDCTIWVTDEQDVAYGEFQTKREAMKFAREMLIESPTAIADIRKWNKSFDDFEDWQYRKEGSQLVEVLGEWF